MLSCGRLFVAALGAAIVGSCGVHSMVDRPVINVKLGQTVEELQTDNVYDFNLDKNCDEDGDCIFRVGRHSYDLAIDVDGKRLFFTNIGGDPMFEGSITSWHNLKEERQPRSIRIVAHVGVRPQNRLMTIDEAIGFAKGLDAFFQNAGFQYDPVSLKNPFRPFQIEEQLNDNAADELTLQSFDDLERAMKDDSKGIVTVGIFSYKKGNIETGLSLMNVKRYNAKAGVDRPGSHADVNEERVYLFDFGYGLNIESYNSGDIIPRTQ